MSLNYQLQNYFNQYRKISIQRSSISICIILFPNDNNANYKLIVEQYWLRDNELNFDNLKSLILKYE